jgi:RNA polymerase sigma factor (sigma-70 family)
MTTREFNSRLVEHNDSLRGFAYNLTRNTDDALDLIQETFLKALLYKDSFTNQSNFKAWLMTIMKNTFINAYNRSIKGNRIVEEITALSSNSHNNTEIIINTKELNKAINALKDDYKIPMQRFIDGFKYHEIADELKLPIGTIKSRIFTARGKIANTLNEKSIK